jgi:hypothetical protein
MSFQGHATRRATMHHKETPSGYLEILQRDVLGFSMQHAGFSSEPTDRIKISCNYADEPSKDRV